MIYPKTHLVRLIKDAILCYEAMVNKMPKNREKQIQTLDRLCSSVQFDKILIIRIKYLIAEIDRACSGWIRWMYAPGSRFSSLLREAVAEYEKSILLINLHYSQAPTRPLVSTQVATASPIMLPYTTKLIEEARQLCIKDS